MSLQVFYLLVNLYRCIENTYKQKKQTTKLWIILQTKKG